MWFLFDLLGIYIVLPGQFVFLLFLQTVLLNHKPQNVKHIL